MAVITPELDENRTRQLRISTHPLAREMWKCSPRAYLQRNTASARRHREGPKPPDPSLRGLASAVRCGRG